jgi:hypothetical protein
MRSDIVPGAVFPDYELSEPTGKHRKLSELQGWNPWLQRGLEPDIGANSNRLSRPIPSPASAKVAAVG